MKELMLELLTYEPYRTLVSGEEAYINEILAGNYDQPESMFHDLFSGFYHYIQNEKFEDTEDVARTKRLDWLRLWKKTYIQGKRDHYPLLFKKICFYIIVRWKIADDKFTDRKFIDFLDLRIKHIKNWRIAPQLRSSAEKDTYSVIKSYRSGVKKPYIVSIVKKLYYEAGRQVSKSTTLNKLPRFVDVFAGTAGVAASMGDSKEFPHPIVNDYDPVMVCFAWAFTYCQRKLREGIAEFHNELMKMDFESTDWGYNAKDYERHYESIDPENLLTSPKIWDDPGTQSSLIEFSGLSKEDIDRGRMLAQRHKEFVIRTRNSYNAIKKVLDLCDKDALRDIINSNKFPKNLSKKQAVDILDYALATYYYFAFAPSGKNGNVYHETIVDVCSYFSYLSRLQVDLNDAKRKDKAVKAWTMTELQLEATSLTLESTGNFSRHLRGATFCCKDFKEILRDNPSNKVYYLDSPYFLTVGYDVGFSDDDHKAMLDILRDAKFKWIFSMQFNPSCRCKCTSASDEAKRKKQDHIIKDYGTYYRGFYAPLEVDADQRTCIVPDASMEDEENLKRLKELFVILFDFDAVEKKWPEMKTKTKEMLVVNFDCLRVIPLHDTAVALPFGLFLQYADANMAYQDIVQKAIAWRENNITSNYAGKAPV